MKDGDEIARHLLFEKYRLWSWRLAYRLLPEYHISELTADELMSCAFLGVDIALHSYDASKGDFYYYWRKISINEINHYLREHVIKKKEVNVTLISLDKEDGTHSLHDVIGNEDPEIINDDLTGKVREVIYDKKTGLTSKEIEVVELYLNGLSFFEISKRIKCSRDTVYRRFKSAVKKMRHFYEDLK